MGVPKFFAFMYERYPCIMQEIRNHQVPDFDNLYLDVNGILHNCSHPNDGDPHHRISEEQIVRNISNYIELLVRVIQPQKLFFMAVDGVAPRAKMNQQRGRRFRSAREAAKLVQKARERGEQLPEGEMFDSNCITPGTEFMARLHEQLKYLVNHKISTDPLWQRPKVILSGHDTPGEGEHKIMDYIRYMRSQDDWNPLTRHCLYGLDADLIMLGLCTHEPHISLLREEIIYGSKNKKNFNPEETRFFLLHLSLMRDYLDLEFQALKKTLPFEYNLENVIDDWVLMGFLIGNDFIPHLPHMHIHASALQILYSCYTKVLPTLDGYINEKGVLNLERFEKFMTTLAEHDLENFRGTRDDLKYLASKTGREMLNCEDPDAPVNEELQAMIKDTDAALGDESDDGSIASDNSEEILLSEFSSYKKGYYFEKLDFENITEEELHSQAECYVRAIQWNLLYYYRGCPSWSWYYPHHYAPFISDIKDFKDLKIEFELGTPFKPFQQLLAVLPSASMNLLPKPFQTLMVSADSPIAHFYPNDFEVDLNGKRNDWEAIILIPFIDQKLLVDAMEQCEDKLTPEEKLRNTHGPMRIYVYTPEDLGPYFAPAYFPPITSNHASVICVELSEIVVSIDQLRIGLIPGALGTYIRGFPNLSHLPFTVSFERGAVKVFNFPSRNENMMLNMRDPEPKSLIEWAELMLGKVVLVNWPHLIPAKVINIKCSGYYATLEGGKTVISDLDKSQGYTFGLDKAGLSMKYKTTMGIIVKNVEFVVYAQLLEGERFVFDNKGKAVKTFLWSKTLEPFPIQLVVNSADMPLFTDTPSEMSVLDVFSKGEKCLLLSSELYGTACEIEGLENGLVSVKYFPDHEPDLSEVIMAVQNERSHYYPCAWIGQRLSISGHPVSRITGSVFIQSPNTSEDKMNIGLNLKFNKRNEEVLGYTRKEGNMWLYSEKVLMILKDYINKFPEIFEFMTSKGNSFEGGNDVFFKDDIFHENAEERVKELIEWKKSLVHMSKAEKRKTGSKLLLEESIALLESLVEKIPEDKEHPIYTTVPPTSIYMPPLKPLVAPDPDAEHKLLDRIIMATKSHPIPVGSKGTIIGIDPSFSDKKLYLYDILFDKPIVVGTKMGCKENRCFRLTEIYFINISYGKRSKKNSIVIMSPGNQIAVPVKILRKENVDSPESSSGTASSSNEKSGNASESFNAFLDAFKRANKVVDQANRKEEPTQSGENNPGNADFRDMWNDLQNPSRGAHGNENPGHSEPQPPSSYVHEQTSALKKVLRISLESTENIELRPGPPLSNCQMPKPINPVPPLDLQQKTPNYCGDLIAFCCNRGYPAPVYQFKSDFKTGYLTRVVVNYKVFYGSPSENKSIAAESAAKAALDSFSKNPVIPPNVNLPRSRGPTSIFNKPHNLAGGGLPQPPFQWYQNNKNSPNFNPRPLTLGSHSFGHGSPDRHQPTQDLQMGSGRMPQVPVGPSPSKAFIPPQLELGNRHFTPHNLHRKVTAPSSSSSLNRPPPSLSSNPTHLLASQPCQPPHVTGPPRSQHPITQTDQPPFSQPPTSSTSRQGSGRGKGRKRIAANFSNPIVGSP